MPWQASSLFALTIVGFIFSFTTSLLTPLVYPFLSRRIILSTLGGVGALSRSPPGVMAIAGDTVTVNIEGEEITFPAQPLKKGFDRGLEFPVRDITTDVFGPPGTAQFEESWPYGKEDMKRIDESDDSSFYDAPRLVYHIDGGAVAALTRYYSSTIEPGSDILDICSSWVSHYPSEFPNTMGRIVATGMNRLELAANEQLTGGFIPSDLNKNSTLPFPDSSFDVVTCVVSVDYLIKPLQVFREVRRVLRPNGRFVLSQSNRLFFTKAIAKWVGLDDFGRLELIGDYFHYAGGFSQPKAFDITARGNRNYKDPMYIVEAMKLK